MLFDRFLKDRKAGVAPLLALGIMPLMGAVGAAVDYSRANSMRTSMQSALDATALMLAKDTTLSGEQYTTKGTNYFNANFAHPEVQNVAVTVASSPAGGGTSLSLSATGAIQ